MLKIMIHLLVSKLDQDKRISLHHLITRMERMESLEKLYAICGEYYAFDNLNCKGGCAACCTADVTLTTLEAQHVLDYVKTETNIELSSIITLHEKRYIPDISLNTLADKYAKKEAYEEKEKERPGAPCFFLKDDLCSVYPARPMMCRIMLSQKNCHEYGVADMPPLAVTLSNILLQVVEHLDADGYTGNISDVISYVSRIAKGNHNTTPDQLVKNRKIPLLMLPPEDKQKAMPMLTAIGKIL